MQWPALRCGSAVVQGPTAFLPNIFPGDVLQAVQDSEALRQVAQAAAGRQLLQCSKAAVKCFHIRIPQPCAAGCEGQRAPAQGL